MSTSLQRQFLSQKEIGEISKFCDGLVLNRPPNQMTQKEIFGALMAMRKSNIRSSWSFNAMVTECEKLKMSLLPTRSNDKERQELVEITETFNDFLANSECVVRAYDALLRELDVIPFNVGLESNDHLEMISLLFKDLASEPTAVKHGKRELVIHFIRSSSCLIESHEMMEMHFIIQTYQNYSIFKFTITESHDCNPGRFTPELINGSGNNKQVILNSLTTRIPNIYQKYLGASYMLKCIQ